MSRCPVGWTIALVWMSAGCQRFPDCDPDGSVEAWHAIEYGDWPPSTTLPAGLSGNPDAVTWDIDTTCQVDEVVSAQGGASVTVRLSCTDPDEMPRPLELHVTGSPTPSLGLAAGETVALRHLAVLEPWDQHSWTTVRAPDGMLLLVAASARTIEPLIDDMDISPLTLALVTGVCPTESSTCGTTTRHALEATLGGSTIVVLDGNLGTVGEQPTYRVQVGSAVDHDWDGSGSCADGGAGPRVSAFALPE